MSDYFGCMENELRTQLLALEAAYLSSTGLSRSTVGRLAAGDWRFFTSIETSDRTFTARKYDEVVAWFSANWPDGAMWPPSIIRPHEETAA